jgi:hypothetical protein
MGHTVHSLWIGLSVSAAGLGQPISTEVGQEHSYGRSGGRLELTDFNAAGQPERIELPLVWVGIEDVPILLANQYLGQVQQQEIILTLGQVTPPVLLGSPEQLAQQVERLSFVPVKTVARFGLTRTRLEELIGVLQATARQFDAQNGDGT